MLDDALNDAFDDEPYACRDCLALFGQSHHARCAEWGDARCAREDRSDEIAEDFRSWGRGDAGDETEEG